MAVIPIKISGSRQPISAAATTASQPGYSEPSAARPYRGWPGAESPRAEGDEEQDIPTRQEPVPPDSVTEPEPSETDRIAELRRAYDRLMADFENYKRNAEKDRADAEGRGRDELVEVLVPVLADLSAASRANGEDVSAVRRGVALIRAKLENALARMGYQRIPTENEKMDPKVHEAIATVPAPSKPGMSILEELQPGYLRGDRLVTPARVVVATGTPGDDDRPEAR